MRFFSGTRRYLGVIGVVGGRATSRSDSAFAKRLLVRHQQRVGSGDKVFGALHSGSCESSDLGLGLQELELDCYR